jgi:hypothetical protein
VRGETVIKRFLMLAAVAGALCFPAAVTAAKGTDVVQGPACGNIDLSGDYTFNAQGADSGPATVFATITTVAPSCKKGTYTVYVFDATGATQLTNCVYPGDGVTTEFGPPCQYTSSNGADLCVYATSAGDDGHIIDTAPNEGCSTPFAEPIHAGPSAALGFH